MKISTAPQSPVTDVSVQATTGRSFKDWFALLDEHGGAAKGRKAVNDILFKDHKVDAWWTSTIAVEYERARELVEKDGKARGYAICVTKNIKAPAASVYQAFITPGNWLGAGAASQGSEGGTWHDGDGNGGTYKKLAAGKTIRTSFTGPAGQESQVEIKLAEKNGVCGVVLNHERILDRGEADGLRTAWGEALTALKQHLER